jgi:hypothetical protein
MRPWQVAWRGLGWRYVPASGLTPIITPVSSPVLFCVWRTAIHQRPRDIPAQKARNG